MRIAFSGEDQTNYISKLYQANGYSVAVLTRGTVVDILRNIFKVIRADVVYQVFGRDISKCYYLRLASLLGKRIIIHWIGTDVLIAAEQYQKKHCVMNARFPHVDLACAEHLQRELKEIGIEAEYVPIFPVDIEFSPLPAPKRHAVLSYVPEKREVFYGINELKALAAKFPDIPFFIVANSGGNDPDKLPNVYYKGTLKWHDLRALYAECSILFRYTKHDGLPVMVLEALGLGRQAIFSYRFPYAHTPAANTQEAIEEEFRQIVSVPPVVNYAGSRYVAEQFQTEKLVNTYKKLGIL